MIKGLNDFKMDLDNFYKVVVPQNHLQLCKRIAVRLHQAIVAGCPENPKGTPVDTGWARANWGVKIGRSVPTKPVGKYEPGRSKYTTGQSNPIPQDSYFGNIENILISAPPFPFIWVYNNVPYIEILEDGDANRPPVGMVISALHTVQTFMDNDL